MKEALLYHKLKDNKVACFLCAHHCSLNPGQFGVCGVRENIDGVLYTYAYGKVVSANIDPIEKKPIYHLLPGSKSFSIACIGCNFRCSFCQNWEISQKFEADKSWVKAQSIEPSDIVFQAKKFGCKSIAYTYTEPTIFFEYALEIAELAKKQGLYNIFVTNGYMTKEALETIEPYLDAANVDLKFFNDESYRRICGGRLEPVLSSIRLMRKLKVWVEVTTLIVPGENDTLQELKGIADFIAQTGKEIPWHISRFHPDYKMDSLKPTPIIKLKEAYKIGKDAGIRYVYIGNLLDEEKTFCYSCSKELIVRAGFEVVKNEVKDSMCPNCNAVIDGVKI